MAYTNPLAHIKLDGTTMDIRDAQADAGITSLNSSFSAFQTATNNTLASHTTSIAANTKQLNAIAANMWVSVLDYGADNTGATDSATAFRNALAATPVHGTMYIPNGVYYIGSTIDIKKPVTICGDYVGLDVEAESTAATADQYKQALINSYCSNSPTFEIYGCGVKLANIGIWQKVANNSRMISISAGTGSATVPRNNCFSNIWLNGNYGGGYANIGFGTNDCNLITSTFEFCRTIYTGYGYAIGADNKTTTSIAFINCWAEAFTDYGYLLKHAYYCSLTGCAADGAVTSPQATGGYAFNNCLGVTMDGCGTERAQRAVQLNSSKAFAMIGCGFANINSAGTTTNACVMHGGTVSFSMIGCSILDGSSVNLIYTSGSMNISVIACDYTNVNIGGTVLAKNGANVIYGINSWS